MNFPFNQLTFSKINGRIYNCINCFVNQILLNIFIFETATLLKNNHTEPGFSRRQLKPVIKKNKWSL